MVALEERHHTFLQALLRRGPLPDNDSKKMYRELFECSNDKFFDFISTVNKELDYLQMEIRGCTNQYDGTLYYGVINKLASEESKLGTQLTHPQLTFFKAIMESILMEPSATGVISSMKALNLRLDTQGDNSTQGEASTSQAAPLKLTLAGKEETLATLVSENWLSRLEDGRVALGMKSFLELKGLFRNFDVPFCEVCNEAAIKAQPCENEDCNARMHSYCIPRKFSRRQVPRVCPSCGTAWTILPGTMNEDQDHNPGNDAMTQEVAEEDVEVALPRARRVNRTRRHPKSEVL